MREMKAIVFFELLIFLLPLGLIAQEEMKKGQSSEVAILKPQELPRDWHWGCMEVDTVSGADIYRAYDYLKGREPKARTVVAIIDAGGDVTHRDLKERLWVNRKEIPGNGIDDDNNGFADDVHGWNFLGFPDGKEIPGTVAMDWEFLRLHDKFADVDTMKLSRKEKAEYRYFVEVVKRFSTLRSFPDSSKTYRKKVEVMRERQKMRESVGDGLNSLKIRHYGNNNLVGANAHHGTHVGGIVGAKAVDESGANGIADVELRFVRVLGKGDEQDKDVASAIFYAVENGARVINMSINKYFSPNKELVYKAMRYAERRGVLIVNSAGNDSFLLDEYPAYPNKFLSRKKTLRNFICVGSIGPYGEVSRFSNYGKNSVDIFAPGEYIYSTILNNEYRRMSGTSMAAPVVTGVAALIWNYFPELTAEQVKRAILEGAESWEGRRVDLPRAFGGKRSVAKVVNFEELCGSGGVLNALQAVKLAERMSVE